ncbi:MAG: hypothetical protein GX564_03920, partial [Oligosphaeraceae bacterium]|nr:hypothetical protein [Oligosphaeraceae bacterium]
SPKESGSLGWEDYKQSATAQDGAYKKTLSTVQSLAAKVIEQRNTLTASILDSANALNYPAEVELNSADLNSLDKYAESAAKMVAHAKAVAERDAAIVQKVNEVAVVVNASIDDAILARPVVTDEAGQTKPGDYKVDEAFADFKQKVEAVLDRCQLFSAGVIGAVAAIDKHSWNEGLRPQTLAKADANTLRAQLELLAGDCQKINDSLKRREFLEGEYDKQKSVIGELEEKLTRLEGENEKQLSRLKKLEERVGVVDADQGEKVESWDSIDQNTIGKVMRVNQDFGFVVVDLSEKKVMRDVRLAVTRAGNYVATLAVIKAMPYQSIADLTHGNIADIKVGDEIIISARQMQPEQILRGAASREDDSTAPAPAEPETAAPAEPETAAPAADSTNLFGE